MEGEMEKLEVEGSFSVTEGGTTGSQKEGGGPLVCSDGAYRRRK